MGGESTHSTGLVPGDYGFAQMPNFEQLLAHFAVALAVEQ